MEKKKALLVVAGGRAVPDVLALFYVQPHLIIVLTSEEGWRDEPTFVEIANSLPNHEQLLPTLHVKSHKFEEIKQACIEACQQYPESEWEWTFSIGSCPKIMGIAAYEVAKQKHIPCIYIDTQHEEVVSLVKRAGIPSKEFFHMNVCDYMKTQHRKRQTMKPDKVQYRKIAETWGHIATILALSPDTPSFIRMMHDKKEKIPVSFSQDTLAESSLVQTLKGVNAIEIESNPNGPITCTFSTKHFAKFIGTGDWLEVYVWHEAKKASFADDCQWGYEISSAATNELDVVLTFNAQLVFAECKTDEEPFKGNTDYLDKINNKAEMLGRSYVTKLFITNASNTRSGYANFLEQAKLRRIVVVTAEDLPNIGKILKREAINPTYPRI